VAVPRAKERVALLYRETDVFGGSSHEGEHGGASLAEVIAPAFLVGADTLAVDARGDGSSDSDLELRALRRPDWWDLVLPPRREAPPKLVRLAPETQQLSLLDPKPALQPTVPISPQPTASPVAPVARPPAPWHRAIAAALEGRPATTKERLLREIIDRVEVLRDHGARMPAVLFATRANVLPFRVAGAVAAMGEVLNIDGYRVVAYDPADQGSVLFEEQLFQQLFGGKP
jgi:hypothetical protein